MQLTFTLFAALATSVSASAIVRRQTAVNYPTCALSCLAGLPLGPCVATDTVCLCHEPSFITDTTECFSTSCTGADVTQAIEAGVAFCAAVNVTVTSIGTPSTTYSFSVPSATA
ncbi:hypothetical protein BV25DRAFT_1921615 [Artomyces pyxidatus]|uniref:Uncharacterized protein n=1 Tax=Artomyces pyxidatus TaxID=48021 RepID=A0ACB8SH56_9AGAM|nr:hypothetical protein BV25DRAFT_1921615 [Artomyces pyxidatus]